MDFAATYGTRNFRFVMISRFSRFSRISRIGNSVTEEIMYREQSKGWLKHFDFAVLDVLCLQLSFWLSYALTGHRMDTFQTSIFKSMAVFLLMADIMVIFSFSTLKNVMKRGN